MPIYLYSTYSFSVFLFFITNNQLGTALNLKLFVFAQLIYSSNLKSRFLELPLKNLIRVGNNDLFVWL